MTRKIIGALAPLALLAALLGVTPAAHAADKDCGDFASQKRAQIFFLEHGGPQRDPHRLDAEGDGIACESNPCPCYRKKKLPSGGGNGGGTNGGGGNGGGTRTVVQMARIIRVIDGDTVEVRLAGGGRRDVRLIGIDTPEMSGPQCGARMATRAMKSRAPRGTRVKLVSDPTQDLKDRYGRILRYVVKRSNNRDLNRAQVLSGWAAVYVYDHTPFKRTRTYRKAQATAKKDPRGVWKSCT